MSSLEGVAGRQAAGPGGSDTSGGKFGDRQGRLNRSGTGITPGVLEERHQPVIKLSKIKRDAITNSPGSERFVIIRFTLL